MLKQMPISNHWRVTIRPFKWDDLYAVQGLINQIAQYEDDPNFYTLEWLHFVLSQTGVDAEQNCFVAVLPTDRIIGFSRITQENASSICVYGGVHPDFRGVGAGRWLLTISDLNMLMKLKRDESLRVQRCIFAANYTGWHLLECAGYRLHSRDDETNQLVWQKEIRL